MKLRKTLNVVLSVCLILLTVSSCSKIKWDWEGKPYAADSASFALYGKDGDVISCSDEKFDDFICFTTKNIEDLVFNIKRLKYAISNTRGISRTKKRRAMFHIDKVLKRLQDK